MLNLQDDGVHNINLVTPTHFVPQIISAIKIARKDGLNLPIVYNTSGYESEETLNLLYGYVDIYIVDVKYADKSLSTKYSNCPNYPEIIKKALMNLNKTESGKEVLMKVDPELRGGFSEASDADYEHSRKLINDIPKTCGMGCHPKIKL